MKSFIFSFSVSSGTGKLCLLGYGGECVCLSFYFCKLLSRPASHTSSAFWLQAHLWCLCLSNLQQNWSGVGEGSSQGHFSYCCCQAAVLGTGLISQKSLISGGRWVLLGSICFRDRWKENFLVQPACKVNVVFPLESSLQGLVDFLSGVEHNVGNFSFQPWLLPGFPQPASWWCLQWWPFCFVLLLSFSDAHVHIHVH